MRIKVLAVTVIIKWKSFIFTRRNVYVGHKRTQRPLQQKYLRKQWKLLIHTCMHIRPVVCC